MEAVLESEAFNKARNDVGHRPLIVMGDFNCPSHLDWTEKTKRHVVHRAEVLRPRVGLPIPEPQDRIDFIFYRGEKLVVRDSFNYESSEPLKHVPDQWNNDDPSDHYAVVTDFVLQLK